MNPTTAIPSATTLKAKTAFITSDETGQFERMIFGLTNGPYEFSRLMALSLGLLKNQVVMSYLDLSCKRWPEMIEKNEADTKSNNMRFSRERR